MNGKYKEDYLQFIAEAANNEHQITLLVKSYIEKNDYKDPTDWCKAHGLCQLSYQLGTIDADTEQLMGQLLDKQTMLSSSESLNEADYDEWFGVTKRLNDSFIDLGYAQARQYQYDLLSSARPSFVDVEAAQAYLK